MRVAWILPNVQKRSCLDFNNCTTIVLAWILKKNSTFILAWTLTIVQQLFLHGTIV